MHKSRLAIPAVVVGLTLGSISSATAVEPYDLVLPAGQACAGFNLGLNITENPGRVLKEFRDADGNPVRTISAGRGSVLLFTNLDTGATVSLRSNGSVSKSTFNPDGSSTVQNSGHNVIILFPTDITTGPSTSLYVGRVVYTSTPVGEFEIVGSSGRTRDLCSELG